jgi:hypothetical protein
MAALCPQGDAALHLLQQLFGRQLTVYNITRFKP